MKYTITIPEPCHESWATMTATEQGRFCDSCNKEVVDFSNTSMAMLSQKLDTGSKLCGRFRPEQLNRPIRSSKGNAIRQQGVLVATVALLAGITPVVAQSQEPTIKVVPSEMIVGRIAVHSDQETRPVGKEIVTITGSVRSGVNLLTGADIRVKDTRIKTKTDADGSFKIQVSATKMNPIVVLEVSYVDHETEEVEVFQTDTPIDIELAYQGFIMGDIIIEENPNLIERIGNGFKRKEN